MWENGCRPDYCTSTDGEDGYDCCGSMDWGEPANCANGYSPWPGDDCQYTCCPASAGFASGGGYEVSGGPMTFGSCENHCASLGGTVACVTSDADETALDALRAEATCGEVWVLSLIHI